MSANLTIRTIDLPLSPATQLLITARLLEHCAAKFAHQAEILTNARLAEAAVRVNDHAREALATADLYRKQATRMQKIGATS